MVVDTYPRGENNFAAPGYDYPLKTYMHAQQAETLTITGDKGSNGETSTVVKGVFFLLLLVILFLLLLLL